MYSPLVLVVLIEQNDKICIVSDCLFWNPKVILCKIEAISTAMAGDTEIFFDRPLLLYHYIVKHHDAALFRIQFICWDDVVSSRVK